MGELRVKYGKHGMHALLRKKHHRNFSDKIFCREMSAHIQMHSSLILSQKQMAWVHIFLQYKLSTLAEDKANKMCLEWKEKG